MTKVISMASMSLDGFIAGPGESGFEHLFHWLQHGDVEVRAADWTFHIDPASKALWDRLVEGCGATVIGRRLFDLTDGWHGNPPDGAPVVVVSHSVPEGWAERETAVPFEFVDGIGEAMERARAHAGGKWVAVNGGTMARQFLEAGLLDEVWVALVPVLLGDGVRFFEGLTQAPALLDGPVETVQGQRVTHLRYDVRK
ncbi:dihydrofolate reductase family protein [Streptomyces sp. NPDC051940]|uniref:dihydrofolate reductase family protein n=1 Tax=Streptomyces sp. NPDC051940 TaxID=3155675 RepID=UPI0034351A26